MWNTIPISLYLSTELFPPSVCQMNYSSFYEHLTDDEYEEYVQVET